ncbi:MAG: hypothetical protein KGZ74_09240 [Chitinophagaceae bacterium]|nr:hypothetical protein [Chitinophagaceae bacterium]
MNRRLYGWRIIHQQNEKGLPVRRDSSPSLHHLSIALSYERRFAKRSLVVLPIPCDYHLCNVPFRLSSFAFGAVHFLLHLECDRICTDVEGPT